MASPALEKVLVVVRRRWNDPHNARVAVSHIREPHFFNDVGGVCGAFPRPFLQARVWCDHLIDGAGVHVCDADTAPHELELCILQQDNAADVYAGIEDAIRR